MYAALLHKHASYLYNSNENLVWNVFGQKTLFTSCFKNNLFIVQYAANMLIFIVVCKSVNYETLSKYSPSKQCNDRLDHSTTLTYSQ
jgi:hypothetical protein